MSGDRVPKKEHEFLNKVSTYMVSYMGNSKPSAERFAFIVWQHMDNLIHYLDKMAKSDNDLPELSIFIDMTVVTDITDYLINSSNLSRDDAQYISFRICANYKFLRKIIMEYNSSPSDEGLIKEVVLFSPWFEPPEEFKEMTTSLGYDITKIFGNSILKIGEKRNKSLAESEIIFDKRIIEFIKQRETQLRGINVYKGSESLKFKIGFSGVARIATVDTSKMWMVGIDEYDLPCIEYCNVNTLKCGYTTITKER